MPALLEYQIGLNRRIESIYVYKQLNTQRKLNVYYFGKQTYGDQFVYSLSLDLQPVDRQSF